MARRTDYRTEQAGLRLTHHVAPAVTVALQHLVRELNVADGWVAKGDSAGRGSSDNTTTEAAVILGGHIRAQIDEITDAIWGVEISVNHLAKLVIAGIGTRVPAAADELRCRDAQHGRDANLWSDDVQCPDLPAKRGLCNRHYMQYYRYRIAHRLSVEQDFELGVGL